MTTLNITVYIELNDKLLKDAVSSAVPPHNVYLTFSDGGNITDFPNDSACIVITDDYDRANTLADAGLKGLHIVFAGKGKLGGKLDDVWDTSDPAEIKIRTEKLIKSISDAFFADFYERTLYTTIDTVPDMLWFKRLDGIHTMVNTAFTKVVHKNREDIIGRDHFYIWDAPRPTEGNAFACAESEENAINSGKMYVCNEPVMTREGMKQLITYKTPVYDMFGNVFGTVGIGHDVTNFSNLGIELSILVENIPFPMIIFTSDMKVVEMNDAFMKVAELSADDVADFNYEGWKIQTLVPVSDSEINEEKHYTSQECKIYYNNEGEQSFIVRMQEIRDFFGNISGYFLLMNDVTYQRAFEESMFKAANTDMLTGMYNRRYFYNYLSDNAGKSMTLFYMDLDRFKYVNDHYGHAKGDEVLISTSHVIKTRFPKAVSARIGGDEFALVVEGILDEETIKDYSTNLEHTIQRIFTADGLPVTMSTGVVTYEAGSCTVDELMLKGDEKMYEVKKRHHDEDYE